MGATTSSIGAVIATTVLMTDRTMASSAMTTVVLVFNTTTITPITCKEPISQVVSRATAEAATTTNAEVAVVANLEEEEEVGLLEITTRTTTALAAITIHTRPAECPCPPQWLFLNSHKCSTFQCPRSITVC